MSSRFTLELKEYKISKQPMNQYLPKSCLLGIQFTISTHSGPQVVYHYPPAVAEHISERQRQRSQKSTAFDDKIPKDYSEDGDAFSRKASIAATLTGKSFKSNEFRPMGDLSATSPKVESPTSGSFQNRGGMAVLDLKNESQDALNSELTSDSESSGLSDSEISTDYADCSSTSSSSSNLSGDISTNTAPIEAFNENHGGLEFTLSSPLGNSVTSRSSHPSKILRPKGSQISATRLLDIFSKDTQTRRESRASRISANVTDLRDIEQAEQSDDDLEFLAMMESGSIDMDERYFDEHFFLDTKKIFGFDTELVAEFCSPERSMCNTRFEFTIDSFCFLGLPIHVDVDGNWRKSKRKKNSSNRSKRSGSTCTKASRTRSQSSKSGRKSSLSDCEHLPEEVEGEENDESNTLEVPVSRVNDMHDFTKDDLEKNMDMFHICFVMNPPLVEYNERVDDMFHYVVARLSLLLRYAQAKSKYVSKQCHIILKEREKVLKSSKTYKSITGPAKKAKYLYQRILSKSSLARAITICVDKLQRDEIACLEIGEDKVISLQIPIQSEFRVLPNLKIDPVLRGSYLTSILNSRFLQASSSREDENDAFFGEEEDVDRDDLLNYALLLLDEPSNIINDLETLSSEDDIGNMVLTHLIKHIQPTVPLRSYQSIIDKLLGSSSDKSAAGIQSSFQTSMLRSCALHLLYQRHARVIIPVSSKSTYIVSPLAPIRGYSKNDFTTSAVDSNFSDEPLIYQNREIFNKRFPSLPSLPSFLNLLSGNKPKAFGTIIPSKEHKPIYLRALIWLIRYGYATQLLTFICLRVDKQIKMAVDEDLEKETPAVKKTTSNRDHAVIDNISKGQDNSVSRPQSSSTFQKQNTHAYHVEEEIDEENFGYDDLAMERDYTIILEPERATAVEKRWIVKCIQDQPPDIRILFNKVLKYFNGKTPMESVMIREGISRHELKKLMTSLDRYLIEFHHW